MSYWNTFVKKLGTRLKSLSGSYEITQAYRRVFLDNASREDQRMVLAHYAARCGWNCITPPSVASEELRFNEGKRAAFAELFGHLALSYEDIADFENAVKREVAMANND